MRYWFCVTSPHNYKICVHQRLWGVDYRYKETLEKYVSIRDPFVFYTTGNCILTGVGIVSSKCFEDNTNLGWTGGKPRQPIIFPFRIRLANIHPAGQYVSLKNAAIRSQLVFVTDKSDSWHKLIYGSMLILTEEDYITCLKLMKLYPKRL
jgi:predicted RNA-binding protein